MKPSANSSNAEKPLPIRQIVESRLDHKKKEWLDYIKIGERDSSRSNFIEGELETLLWFLGYSPGDIAPLLNEDNRFILNER